MMKMAVFVEGLTEQVFAERLITEIAGKHAVVIEHRQAIGGAKSPCRLVLIQASAPHPDHKYFAMIVDCGGDEHVKSVIRDRYDSLVAAHYTAIIGVRDVFPRFSHDEIPKLRATLAQYMKTVPFPVLFVLGVMEVETWFMSECSHFERISPVLTRAHIKTSLGIDPQTDDIQLLSQPAADLNAIYGLAGLAYRKNRRSIQYMIDSLDYSSLYLEVADRIPDLKCLVQAMDTFLSS